ncbi:MAG: 30S ribosomal protein S17 [Fidelibacterota bacterium]
MAVTRKKQSLIGEVVSTKMEKTVVVDVSWKVPHPIYKKYIRRNKKYMANVSSVVPKEGDLVKIIHSRPMSKNKKWRVSEIVRESKNIG